MRRQTVRKKVKVFQAEFLIANTEDESLEWVEAETTNLQYPLVGVQDRLDDKYKVCSHKNGAVKTLVYSMPLESFMEACKYTEDATITETVEIENMNEEE